MRRTKITRPHFTPLYVHCTHATAPANYVATQSTMVPPIDNSHSKFSTTYCAYRGIIVKHPTHFICAILQKYFPYAPFLALIGFCLTAKKRLLIYIDFCIIVVVYHWTIAESA